MGTTFDSKGFLRFTTTVVMNSLKQEEVEELQAACNLFSNKKKELDADDLKSVMRQLDIPASGDVIKKMMREADKTNSGKVSFNEFVTMMASRMKEMDSERTVLEAFECFDTVGTGAFTPTEFVQILCKAGSGPHLTDREVKELVKEIGTNADGNVDYRRLVKIMYAKKV